MNELDTTQAGPQMHAGVAVGVVTDNEDPDGHGRVRVTIPCQGEDTVSYWASVATPMAGADMGAYFLPEENDEVLLAFEGGDVHYPYVIGSLWNADQPPPAENEGGRNDKRLIRSRFGHEIVFDDGADGRVEIVTAGGNRITLSDESGAESVTITDADEQNVVEIDASGGGVTVEGAQTISLSAPTLELAATGNITIDAKGQLNLKGSMVNIN